MTNVQILGLALALAAIVEGFVEYFFGQAIDHLSGGDKWRWALIYVAAIAGVGLAFYYKLDLMALISEQESTGVGYFLSGLIIGRGANFLHDFVSKYILQKQFNTSAQGDTDNPVA